MFQDRAQELAALDRHWCSGHAEALIALGRRRVGKTHLLEHFFADKPHVYLVGTRAAATIQLADATASVTQVTHDPVLEQQPFTRWDALLTYVAEKARDQRLGLVLDEFAYFCDESPELPSVVQRWWDRHASRGRLMLILAGSHVAFMEQVVLGGPALYGRRTGELRLQPFDYFDAARFVPTYTPADRIRTYAVFGGMAAYHAKLDPARTLAENIVHLVLEPGAFLRHEPSYLLSQERGVERPSAYLSVLRAIADGNTQPSRIAAAVGLDSASDVMRVLEKLRTLRLVERLVPAGSEWGRKTRASIYVLTDQFLRFWFAFVAPSEAPLESGATLWTLEQRILPRLDEYVSQPNGPWEEACRAYLWRAGFGRLIDVGFDQLGPWWEGRSDGAVEIDALALQGSRVVLAASCKWRNEWVKIGDLNELMAAAARAGADAETRYVLFSRDGFDSNLIELAAQRGVLLVTPDDMFDPALER